MRWLSVFILVLASVTFSSWGAAEAAVQFDLQGSLTTASAPFALSDEVSGNVVVADAATAPGYVSLNPFDILSYSFTIGDQNWSGTGDNFLGIFGFEVSVDGQQLFFNHAGGGLTSAPGDFFLDIVTNEPNQTEWIISSGADPGQVATAFKTMIFLTGTSGPCNPLVDCPGIGGAVFSLSGNLSTASEPFLLTDPVEGCFRVSASAANPGYVSTDPMDVLNYSFTIGDQTWSGTGADFLGIFEFEISANGQELFFKHAGGGLASSPGAYLLDIVTNEPGPTEWIISNGMGFDQAATASNTMGFCLADQPVSLEARSWGGVKTLFR